MPATPVTAPSPDRPSTAGTRRARGCQTPAFVGPLSTYRLDLEPLGLQHVDDLLALDSDPEVMRYISGGRASTLGEVEAVVRRSIGQRWVAARAVHRWLRRLVCP
jgi:hypothetical protein